MSISVALERTFREEVGACLRGVRRLKRLTLNDVARASHGAFTSAVLGAYERGTRAISVSRLRHLAEIYDVPIDELLPDDRYSSLGCEERTRHDTTNFRINLTTLRQSVTDEAVTVRKFVDRVRKVRHDYEGRVLTIRIEDLRVLGAVFGHEAHEMVERLDDLHLLVRARR